jgi:hypothetical protein
MIRRIFGLAGLILCASGCMTAPMKMDKIVEGNWKAKALIRDKEQSRSYIVNLNLNAVRGTKTRMDVTSALNTGVASLVSDDKEVRYILFDSKRYYFGKPQPGVMRPILSIPFDPRWLQNMVFDLPISEKSWSCTTASSGLVDTCTDSTAGLKVSWSQRMGPNKTITIEHAKATVQINIQSFKSKVEDRKNLFALEAPEGYQKLQVR